MCALDPAWQYLVTLNESLMRIPDREPMRGTLMKSSPVQFSILSDFSQISGSFGLFAFVMCAHHQPIALHQTLTMAPWSL